MRRVIVGTAGHIDHGKTKLVEALTGTDCDRWDEEKQRGITIDLGFALLERDDLQVGFVDVPGHEKFLHNALAGLGGIRIMLLVVAADEGVKPQTEEHLAICSLLGIPAGLVALTKADLVDSDLLELAELEVDELLAATPFAGSPIVKVSSVTGEGIAELEERLLELAGEHFEAPDTARPARLPSDRAFHLKGLGLTVTGTLVAGAIAAGDPLELLTAEAGERLPVRVRDVQVHGQPRERAEAGERTSLRLSGVELEQVTRGSQLATPGTLAPSRRLLARFTLLPDAPAPISGFVPVRLHLYSSEVIGKLRPRDRETLSPGETATVEIRTAAPVVAVRGDRFIVRRPSPQTTLGGGTVLDPAWRHRRGKALAQAIDGLSGDRPRALVTWVAEAGEGGIGAARLAPRLGDKPERLTGELTALTADGKLLAAPAGAGHPPRWIVPAAYRRVEERAKRRLAEYFERNRMAAGMPKAEAVERFLPGRAAQLSATYLGWLADRGVLALEGDRVDLPGRGDSLTAEESQLAQQIQQRYERAGLTPPAPAEVARELGAKPQIVDGVVRYLTERGRLVRLPGGLLLAATAVDELVGRLAETGWERFSVPQFKDHFGLSRKWAIPLLEHLDSTGATRRIGDERLVAR